MKIQIIGFSGAGKSTLSKQLGKFYNLPVLHMDSLNFLDNWVERDRLELNQIVDKFLLDNDSWVIDGNYFRISPIRYRLYFVKLPPPMVAMNIPRATAALENTPISVSAV